MCRSCRNLHCLPQETTHDRSPTRGTGRSLQAAGAPVRLQILDILRRSPECVCVIWKRCWEAAAVYLQQLRVLREAGVIVDSKEGLNVFYQLADPRSLRC